MGEEVSPKYQTDGAADAYLDRNATAQALAVAMGYLGVKHGVRGRNSDWPIIVIDMPHGQVSWHVPRSELNEHLPDYDGPWDGHDFKTKIDRLRFFDGTVPW